MIDINELRRLAQAATSGEWYVERGNHIYGRNEVTDGEEVWHPVIACTDDDEVNVNFEANAAFIAAANPATISELLDRLEAAEKGRDALQAKIERMEKQGPVAEWAENRFHHYPQLVWNEKYRATIGDKLYALPGAQGEKK